MRTVIFVCTGNTCRSPMAEAIARAAIEAGLLDPSEEVFVASAGIGALEGTPTAAEAVLALKKLGIDYEGRSKGITRQMIERADLVLCMTDAHAEAVKRIVDHDPDQMAKIYTLDPQGDISDPLGYPQHVYDEVARDLQELLPQRLKELLKK